MAKLVNQILSALFVANYAVQEVTNYAVQEELACKTLVANVSNNVEVICESKDGGHCGVSCLEGYTLPERELPSGTDCAEFEEKLKSFPRYRQHYRVMAAKKFCRKEESCKLASGVCEVPYTDELREAMTQGYESALVISGAGACSDLGDDIYDDRSLYSAQVQGNMADDDALDFEYLHRANIVDRAMLGQNLICDLSYFG